MKVYLEMKRRGYEVYVGKLYETEIDFVNKKKDERIYIQVSDHIMNDRTFMREVSTVLDILDTYYKVLIIGTRYETFQYEGVQIIDIFC